MKRLFLLIAGILFFGLWLGEPDGARSVFIGSVIGEINPVLWCTFVVVVVGVWFWRAKP